MANNGHEGEDDDDETLPWVEEGHNASTSVKMERMMNQVDN